MEKKDVSFWLDNGAETTTSLKGRTPFLFKITVRVVDSISRLKVVRNWGREIFDGMFHRTDGLIRPSLLYISSGFRGISGFGK